MDKAVKVLNQAMALLQAGDWEDAARAVDALVAKFPRAADGWNLKGIIASRTGRPEEAIRSFEQAVTIDPSHVAAINLARFSMDRGAFKRAESLCRDLLRRQPRNADALATLALALHRQGASGEAIESCRQALVSDAGHPAALLHLGVILFETGRYSEALEQAERALAVTPGDGQARRLYGTVLLRLGRVAESIQAFQAVLAGSPEDIGALVGLGNAYFAANDLEKANACFDRIVDRTDDPYILGRACRSLIDSRHGDESAFVARAHALARRALTSGKRLDSGYADFQMTFLRSADFDALDAMEPPWPVIERTPNMHVSVLHAQLSQVRSTEDRVRLVELHRRWGARMLGAIDPAPLPRPSIGRSRGKLRIGLLSSDLRAHPVSYFVEPLIELYDRASVELYCYSFYPGSADAVQQRFATAVDSFKQMAAASNRQAAETIAGDGLDILFELGGSTKHNRLDLLAYRMAPIQASWLGYPHSSGLATIDYILVDPYLKPPNPDLLIERPLLLRDSWVCLGSLGFPEIPIAELPADRNGMVTFGTLNSPYKFTRSCVAAWAQILGRIPASRFLIVRPEASVEIFRNNMLAEFARHGIEPARIAFHANQRGQHLAFYNEIDISLDAFPQTGGTTTCESLWMGVPVITLVGDAFFERLSFSNLSNAGLAALCARTTDEYVTKAVALAEDRKRLSMLRRGLRDAIRSTPLGQREGWVREFEAAARRAAAA